MLLGLKMYVKQYHWLAKGYLEHILADKLEEELDDYIDEAAELYAVSHNNLISLTSAQTLGNAHSFIIENTDDKKSELDNLINLITLVMMNCKVVAEEDNDFKQPIGDYLGRLSNLLMRKLYLIDVQMKGHK